MLDILLFRSEQGGDPDLVRESQRRRYADVALVDQVIEYDQEWRKTRYSLDQALTTRGKTQKEIGGFMKKKETPPPELLEQKKAIEEEIAQLQAKEKECIELRDSTIGKIGNLVPDDVPVHDDEEHNAVVHEFGEFKREDWMLSHYDLIQMAGLANTERGSQVAGSRGYFLTGAGVLLNQALISYAMHFLTSRGATLLQTPFVMNKSLMSKVTGASEDQYLIATSEQPICAYHHGEWIDDKQLPKRYAGYSTCFRKEAGSHGRDQLGIFRVHQFEKVEQFAITSPEGKTSWDEQERMIQTSMDFYQSLGIPYKVVNIVSGELNDAAAKKYDLEAWFPGSNAHRELVSCSNCTDYQSRRLEVRFGQTKTDDGKKKYCHMLNSTLIATERAMCCVIENYQTPIGIRVPDVLQEYMGGVDFIPFVSPPPPPPKLKKGEKPPPPPAQHVPTKEEVAKAVAEARGPRVALQQYMDAITPQLNDALNALARERPEQPLEALASLLAAAAAAQPPAAAQPAAVAPAAEAAPPAFDEAEDLKKKQEDLARKAK
ncbi:Seryl-tRNA synthetase, partial [Emiliania huxleyi CCMP1516]|uniref:serine--tRNA ligase n=2 Tax=Emiliania huxleyi TaxID=2903 RepID=A0A0D3JKK8_EMIH1